METASFSASERLAYSIADFCKLAAISRTTLYRQIKAGNLATLGVTATPRHPENRRRRMAQLSAGRGVGGGLCITMSEPTGTTVKSAGISTILTDKIRQETPTSRHGNSSPRQLTA